MDRTREKLEKLKARVTSGCIKDRDKIIKAAERILGKNHGQRYYAYELNTDGAFEFSECKSLSHEKRIEGKYVIATAEKSLGVLEAVAIYKDLADVERGFRQLKDVLALRPIYHQVEPRVGAHIFVAALARSATPRPATVRGWHRVFLDPRDGSLVYGAPCYGSSAGRE
jgi:transposase